MNGLAVASLVFSIFWLAGFGSILALIFGIRARRQIGASGGRQRGAGLATVGIVLASLELVGLATSVAAGVLGAVFGS